MPLPFDEDDNEFIFPYLANWETFEMLGGSDRLLIEGNYLTIYGDSGGVETSEDASTIVFADDEIGIYDPVFFGWTKYIGNTAFGDSGTISISGGSDTELVVAGNDFIELHGRDLQAIGDAGTLSIAAGPEANNLRFVGGDDEIGVKDVEGFYFINGSAFGDTVLTEIQSHNSNAMIQVAYGDDAVRFSGHIYGDSESLFISVTAGSDQTIDVTGGDDMVRAGGQSSLLVGDIGIVSLDYGDNDDASTSVAVTAGDDRIVSGHGNDTLYGDVMGFMAGDGVVSETAPDDLTYSSGADEFIFGIVSLDYTDVSTFGINEIMDFELGKDEIILDSRLVVEDVYLVTEGTLILTYDGSILVRDVFEEDIPLRFEDLTDYL